MVALYNCIEIDLLFSALLPLVFLVSVFQLIFFLYFAITGVDYLVHVVHSSGTVRLQY